MDATTKLMLNLLASFVQFERDINSERSKEKLQELKRQGVKLGRPVEEKRSQIAEMLREGEKNVSEIAFLFKLQEHRFIELRKSWGCKQIALHTVPKGTDTTLHHGVQETDKYLHHT